MTKQLANSGKWRSDRQLERASGTQVGVETLRTIVVFCGVGLVVVLLLAVGITSLGLTPGNNGWISWAGFDVPCQPRDTPYRETITLLLVLPILAPALGHQSSRCGFPPRFSGDDADGKARLIRNSMRVDFGGERLRRPAMFIAMFVPRRY